MVLALIILTFLLYVCLRKLNHHYNICHALVEVLKSKLFYASPLRFGIISYLNTLNSFVVFLNIFIMQGQFHSLFYVYSFGVLAAIIWPIWTIWFLLKNHDKLEKKSYKDKFQQLYDDVRLEKFSSLLYKSIFIARRFNIVIVNVYFSRHSIVIF